jgi:hypothetical protein
VTSEPRRSGDRDEGLGCETEVPYPAVVTIPAKDWGAFEVWIRHSAKVIPALAELACRTLSWEG